jgi:hypothetical protein
MQQETYPTLKHKKWGEILFSFLLIPYKAACFVQWPNRKTGFIEDEYLYSVKVPRDGWGKINFKRLENLSRCKALRDV